jgi:RNA polymerase sigma factor (sigma-70 family)
LALRTAFERKGEPIDGLNLSDPAPNPETQALSAERAEQVRTVLESLGSRDRAILVDLFFHEQRREEVCARYGVDRAALRMILFRARKRFQDSWTGRK